jgi:hypothetical protein
MKTNQIKTYTEKESCAYGIKGWYTTESTFPNGEAEFYRWM